MGFWSSGPSINERSRGGRIEYFGKCEECGNEKSEWKKSDVENQLKKCAKRDKEDKEKEEKRKKREKERLAEIEERNDRLKKEKAERDEEEKRKKKLARQAEEVRTKMIKGRNQKRREAKGKCPFCNNQPCLGTKPKCAAVIAAGFESIMNTGDPSDPATFDPQLKFYRDNMG